MAEIMEVRKRFECGRMRKALSWFLIFANLFVQFVTVYTGTDPVDFQLQDIASFEYNHNPSKVLEHISEMS